MRDSVSILFLLVERRARQARHRSLSGYGSERNAPLGQVRSGQCHATGLHSAAVTTAMVPIPF
jgi:hypothetical protein